MQDTNEGTPSEPTIPQKMLMALQLLQQQGRLGIFYQGTVPAKVKASRRAKNKVARKSRAANRG